MMKRRDFLKISGALTAHSFLFTALGEAVSITNAYGQQVSLESLRKLLDPSQAVLVLPKDANFEKYQISFNKRVMKTPLVRAMVSTPEAVATCLQWARQNGVPLAFRCGGHSYEGFSQTTGLVIDTRPMDQFEFSGDDFTVGAGQKLGTIYQTLTARGLVIPAGTCPTVGVSGHTTGGGYGMLARPLGLACDSLTGLDLVTADGKQIFASESQNSDLFWAHRGGGGGSFAVVTKLHFRGHQVKNATVFGVSWNVQQSVAAVIMKAWQQWAPNASKQITSLLKTSKAQDGSIRLRFVGQSIGTEAALRAELNNLIKLKQPDKFTLETKPMMDAIRHFAGSDTSTPSVYMKGKSDYLKAVMSDDGISQFLKQLPAAPLDVLFDSYGGAIRNKSDSETAFAHRENTVSSLQYYSEWSKPTDTDARLAMMRTFHKAMRPYMSGSAYVNYCDLDIENYARAYWGTNLERLQTIKSQIDPENVFRHAQSVPVKS